MPINREQVKYHPLWDLMEGGAQKNFFFPPTFSVLLAGLLIKLTGGRLTGDDVHSSLRCTCRGALTPRPEDASDSWGLCVPVWTKEKGAGVRDFKGKVGSSWVDMKQQACAKQILAGPPRNSGTQKEGQQTGFARFLPVWHILYYEAKLMRSSFKQVFPSDFL